MSILVRHDGGFTELPVSGGSGEEHVNRFRVYFEPPCGKTAQELGAAFRSGFVGFFNGGSNPATVCNSLGKLKFTFGYEPGGRSNGRNVLPDVHDDWVEKIGELNLPNCTGFWVKTLRRNWEDGKDARLRRIIDLSVRGAILGAEIVSWLTPFFPLIAIATAIANQLVDAISWAVQEVNIYINQHHFLAGRRSWMVVDCAKIPGQPDQKKGQKSARAVVEQTNKYRYRPVFFLETAAVEKSSLLPYTAAELAPQVVDMVIDVLGTAGTVITNIPGIRGFVRGLVDRALADSGLNLRLDIVNIWTGLLANYIARTGYKAVKAPFVDGVGWENGGDIRHVTQGSRGDVLPIHPGLV